MIRKVYPTMITPYKSSGEVDFDGVKKIVDWYIEKGCQGVFAVCQSSEMNYLSLDERVAIAKTVVEESSGRLSVVASGHCSESLDEQIKEINAVSETGIDAFILVSNRLDLHNDGDDVWIKNAERLLDKINPDIKLGIYECPMPYKRLLSERILKWCIKTGRFKFIKDTCCDFDLIKKRLEILVGSGIELYNANSQTLLPTLECGAAGFSGVMANFHPELYVWLCENYEKDKEKAELLQSFLGLYAFTESLNYPVTAKYHMNLEGIDIELDSRSKDKKAFTAYQRLVVDQQTKLEQFFKEMIGQGK